MEEKLISFLQDNCSFSGNELIEVIKLNKMPFFTYDKVRSVNLKYFCYLKFLKQQQCSTNKIFYNEIKRFLIECEKYDINPVFLKGLFLSADVYKDLDTRQSNDVDILIKPEEIIKYKNIFLNLEYCIKTYNDIDQEDEEALIKELSSMHIVFYKIVNDYTVDFELHGSVVNPAIVFKNISQEFYENSQQVELLGLNPRVLSVEYNIVFIMLHFFKHLPTQYFHRMIFKRKVHLELTNLNDIALIIEKYGEKIDWYKVFEISKRMQVVKYISMVSRYVNEIYDNIINADFMTLLEQNKEISYMVNGNYERYGLGKFLWLFHLMIDKLYDLSITDLISGETPDTIDLVEIAYMNNRQNLICIKDEDVFINRSCSIKIGQGIERQAELKLQTVLNKELLMVEMQIDHKKCCAYTGIGNYYDYDSIEVIIIKKKYVVHKMFTITKKEDDYAITISSYNNVDDTIVIDKNSGLYELFISDQAYSLKLYLPWRMLEIDRELDSLCSFNVASLVSNPDTNKIIDAFSLRRSDKFVWEFDDIGAIQFCD